MKQLFSHFTHFITAAAVLTVIGVCAATTLPQVSYAMNSQEQAVCTGAGGTVSGNSCALPGNSVSKTIQSVSNLLIFIVGIVAVIMIIIGGFRYATSGGDQSSITAAKNTILYAIIGLIVAFLAYGIAQFVATQIK